MGRFFTRRWLVRAGIAVVVLAALWSATALIVPPTFKSRAERIALETLGRRLTIGDVAFNPWTLALRVDDIALAGASDAAPPQLQIRQLRSKVSVSWVFRLAPIIDRLEIDAPMVRLTRLADGRYDIDDVLRAPGGGAGEGRRRAGAVRAAQHRRPRRRGGLRRPAAEDDASAARLRARRALPQRPAFGARDQCRAAAGLHPRRQPLRFGRRRHAVRRARRRHGEDPARSLRCRAVARLPAAEPAGAAAVRTRERRPVAGVRAAAEAVAAPRGRGRRGRPEGGRCRGARPAPGRQRQGADRRPAAARADRQAGADRHRCAACARRAQRRGQGEPAARRRDAVRRRGAGGARAAADHARRVRRAPRELARARAASRRRRRAAAAAAAPAAGLEGEPRRLVDPRRPARLARRDHLAAGGARRPGLQLRRPGDRLAARGAGGLQGRGRRRRGQGPGQARVLRPGQRRRRDREGRARRAAAGRGAALPARRAAAAARRCA